MIYFASFLIGAVVGLISVTIFAATLRRWMEEKPPDTRKALRKLIYLVLGAGLTDYVIFDVILRTNGALPYYLIGLATVFLFLGTWVFIDWYKYGYWYKRR